MDLREVFTPAAIAANWTEVASNQIPYLGATLFPARKKAGLDLSWLKGSRGLPVSLMPSAFDAKATFRDRIGFEKLETEMPFFREGYKIKEKDRQEMLRVQESTDPYAAEVIARVFDDTRDLIDGANVVPERMIMQLLFPEGGDVGIAIKANGMDYTYKYDTDGSWKTTNYTALTSTATWDKPATADPFAAFKAVKDAIRAKTGTELTVAIMNSYTFNLLSKMDAVKNRYMTTNGMSLGYLTENEVKAVVESTSGLRIAIYDKQYRDESKVAHAFVPNGYVCLIPDGTLGGTWYGTTPEEADLRGASSAEVSIVNTGVAITRVLQEHPVNINTFAPENVFYRLAMKAKNETAEKFQAKIADEVIPSIRRHGAYMTSDTIDKMINSPEFGIKLLTALKDEQDKRKSLEAELDRSKEWYSIKRVAHMNGVSHKAFDWRKLKIESQRQGYGVKKIFDANYGTINVYHMNVWEKVYPLMEL
jgi:hypothetical protein